ncbi:hypothetical protein D3C73_1393280 [compost metagenome]
MRASDAHIVDEDQRLVLEEVLVQVERIVVDQCTALLFGEEAVIIGVADLAVDSAPLDVLAIGVHQQMVQVVSEMTTHNRRCVVYVVVRRWNHNQWMCQ